MCESRGGRPGLPSLINLTVSVDVKQHSTNQQQKKGARTANDAVGDDEDVDRGRHGADEEGQTGDDTAHHGHRPTAELVGQRADHWPCRTPTGRGHEMTSLLTHDVI